VKHRRFSAGYIDTYSDGGSESFSVNGSIPRHGLATGAINLFTHVPASGKRPESNCDSGLLNWSASKK